MSLEEIRAEYGVPARKGMRVTFKAEPAAIVGGGVGHHRIATVRVQLANGKVMSVHPSQLTYHPTAGRIRHNPKATR